MSELEVEVLMMGAVEMSEMEDGMSELEVEVILMAAEMSEMEDEM